MMAARILTQAAAFALVAALITAGVQWLIFREIYPLVMAGVGAAVGSIVALGFRDPEA